MNLKTKADVVNPIEIKEVSFDYCSNLLTNRKPKIEFEENLMEKELVHMIRMTEICEDEDDDLAELTEERFTKTYNTLANTPGAKYDFIVKAGVSPMLALFNLNTTLQGFWSERST